MRLDTVFNDFLATAVTTGTVLVRGDGYALRPVIDIRDVAEAFIAALQAPIETVHNQAINIGADHLNHTILNLAHAAASLVEGAAVQVQCEPSADKRSYRACFDKCRRVFPGLGFRSVVEGGRDLVAALRSFGAAELAAHRPRFVRLMELRRLMEEGRLDASLRWEGRSRD